MPLLFSYGTLQQETVQMSTFGRLLQGQPDELVGFEQSLLKIDNPDFVATSGKAQHAIVRFNGKTGSRVRGTVFELSEGELASADRYERPATNGSRQRWRQANKRGCTRRRRTSGKRSHSST
jgi:Gamma-glutamyl cyclotransferase, AIG2-like